MADENEIFNLASDDRKEIDDSDWEEMEESFSDQEVNASDSEEMIESCSKLENEPQTVTEQNSLKRVYLPNPESDEDISLECDLSAYKVYCPINIGVACSSFDVILDSLGNNRADQYPLAMTLVGGTQMENKLGVMKISNINQTKPSKE
ncbi:Glutamate-rich WD repeat-containing protein 1, partial [Stegodyphus mimosarum]